MAVNVFLLNDDHNCSDFDCGETVLDDYLKTWSVRHSQSGVSKTRVWVKNDVVAGYYSLSMGSISCDNLPKSQAKRFPKHPVPIARIARLAVDKKYQGGGCGRALLVDALENCYRLSSAIGMAAVLVDAKNDNAKRFYESSGFQTLPNQEMTLYLTLKKLKAIFETA